MPIPGQTELERLATRAVRAFTPRLYDRGALGNLALRDSVSLRLLTVSDDLRNGVESEDSRALIETLMRIGPPEGTTDDEIKQALLTEIRVVATLIPMGIYNYVDPAEGALEPLAAFGLEHEHSRAETLRGGESVQSYRKRIHLALEYQKFFLETTLTCDTPSNGSHWHSSSRGVVASPFSPAALGLHRSPNASQQLARLDRIKMETAALELCRDQAGRHRDKFIPASIEQVVRRIDDLIEHDAAGISWPQRFREHAATVIGEIDEQLVEFDAGSRCWVISDVHLGLPQGNDAAFTDLLSACERGDRLVLLGDVLDFWIHLEHEHDLVEIVAAQWRLLHARLASVRRRGVSITYVPGNHDMFVFVLEGAGHLDWCTSLVSRCPSLSVLHQQLAEYRLSSLCEIHYPFLTLDINGVRTLLTHGHAHEFWWDFVTGNPCENGMIRAFIQTAANVMAYRFARQLRGIYLVTNDAPTQWVRHTTDVAMTITNRHLVAFYAKEGRVDTREQRARFSESLTEEFERLTSPSDLDEIRAIDAGHAFKRIGEWRRSSVSAVRKRTSRLLKRSQEELNFRIWPISEFQCSLSVTPFGEIGEFEQFLCGHFHRPRNDHPDYDIGCLLTTGPNAFAMITRDGKIVRPVGVVDA